MNINIKIKNIDKVKTYFLYLPKKLSDLVTKTIAEHLLGEGAGDSSGTGLRGYDPYKFASRKKAYGKVSSDGAPEGYFSWKQFRYVAWKTQGFTTNMGSASNRTGESGKAWTINKTPNGYVLQNDSAGMIFARHDKLQARQLKQAGWRNVSRVLEVRMRQVFDLAVTAVKNYLQAKK